jgi:ceramide glucosyltransferase
MLGAVAIAWAGATTSVALWAWLRSADRAKARPERSRAPSVMLLRPCAGHEPNLAATLSSSSETEENAAVRFLVASIEDPALDTAMETAAVLWAAGRDATVVVTGAQGPNKKADQLHRALEVGRSGHEVVIVADSDVFLSRDVVEELVDVLVRGEAAAAWAAPVEVLPSTAADRASASVLDASLHSFGLLSALDPGGMVGKLFAVRRETLEQIGGFGALIDRLGEDMELARRLRASGRRACVTATPAWSLASGRTWSATVKRYARWITVIRAQRPALLASYPLLFAAAPLQVALALSAFAVDGSAGARVAALALAFACAGRWLTAIFARRRCGRPLDRLVLWPWIADLLLLASFFLALFTRTIRWRGVPLRVDRDGVLVERPS